MNIKGENVNSRVSVKIRDKAGRLTSDGKKSVTFTVLNTTVDELSDFIRNKVREVKL